MENRPTLSLKKSKRFPPRRGQITFRILGKFVKSVNNLASMAIKRKGSSRGGGSKSSSAAPSTYASEGSVDV